MKESKRGSGGGARGGPQAFLERVRSQPKPSSQQQQQQQPKPGGGRSSQPQSQQSTQQQQQPGQRKKQKQGRGGGGGGAQQKHNKGERRRTYERDSDASSHKPAMRGRASKKGAGAKTVTIHGEVQKNNRGFAFLLHKPEDYFIPRQLASKLLTGDVVKATVNPVTRDVYDLEITKRSIKSFIGTYEIDSGRRTVILSDRTMREEVVIRELPKLEGLRRGDKVQVDITRYEPGLEGRIVRSFGANLAPKFDTLAVVVRSQWPQEFTTQVKDEAARRSEEIQRAAAGEGYRGRKDFRARPFVTIDGKDARDFDDAVLVERTSSGYVLYVAIADVSEFVVPGTPLDKEAYARATSVYFPEWVIPMLPEALSNGACSLRPDEEKLTLCCEMHFDEHGRKRSSKVYEAVIKSSRRCIYEDVDREAREGLEFWRDPYALYKGIREQRNRRGALDLDLPEAKIVLDAEGDTIDIRKTERLDSHRLIEEFMIAANESVTEIMEREGWPFVFRVHEPPKAEAVERFEGFAMALGLKPDLAGATDPKRFAQFITTLKDNPSATTLYYLMLRSLKQARYDPVNLKHFGLASRAYTHFTSPIRRYPDLMVHRLIKRFLRREDLNDEALAQLTEELGKDCDHCSRQERKAEGLDRQVTKVKKARFMARHMGEEFDARVINCNENGIYVELERWFVEGLVPVDELGGDWFEFIEERLMLRGKRTGRKFKMGDAVRVSVLRVDLDNGFIDFTLAENIQGDGTV